MTLTKEELDTLVFVLSYHKADLTRALIKDNRKPGDSPDIKRINSILMKAYTEKQ